MADPLAEHDGAHEARHAGIDVHDRAAREVQCSPLPQQAAGSGHSVSLSLCHASRVCIRAGPEPDHVCHRQIAEREPEGQEQQDCRELDALDDGAEDQAAGDGGECSLERDIDQLVQHDPLAEGRGRREIAGRWVKGSVEEHATQAADERIAFGEGQRVAVDTPQYGDQREADEHLHEHRQHVLRADQAAVEQRERRH